MMSSARILDACSNRAAEGLRALEDIARFAFDNRKISSELRGLRHSIRELFQGMEQELLGARDAQGDVGVVTSFSDSSDTREDLKETVLANCKRVQEAFRSMEEILKSRGEHRAGKKVETLRFAAYSLEPDFLSLFARRLPQGIYGILGEKFSLGRSNVEVARRMVDGGIDILQYREKLSRKSLKEIYAECLEIRKITADAGVPFIVNDYADVALMVGADGIHRGQDDLPVQALRKIAPQMMIGCSTHSPEQAKKAIEDGADYIGVGPIFTTQTKEDVCDAVGLTYLEHVVKNYDIPFVAIGGIKRNTLPEVLAAGAKTVCLVTEIIGAENIEQRVQEIKERVGELV